MHSLEELTSSEIVHCSVSKCTNTTSSDILVDCSKCNGSFCSQHRSRKEHECWKQKAFRSGYFQCDRCGFVNAPSSLYCLVCRLCSGSDHDDGSNQKTLEVDVRCPICRCSMDSRVPYTVHFNECKRKYRQKRMDSKLQKLQKTRDPMDVERDEVQTLHRDIQRNEEDSVQQICPKCDGYFSFKIFESHVAQCTVTRDDTTVTTMDTETENMEKCPGCTQWIEGELFNIHLAQCLNGLNPRNPSRSAPPSPPSVDIPKTDVSKVLKAPKLQKCPFCNDTISDELYTDHLAVCSVDEDLREKSRASRQRLKDLKESKKRLSIRTPTTTTSDPLPSDPFRVNTASSMRRTGRRNRISESIDKLAVSQTPRRRGTYYRNSTQSRSRNKTLPSLVPSTSKKRTWTSLDEEGPSPKRRKTENSRSPSITISAPLDGDWKRYRPNLKKLLRRPFHDKTVCFLRERRLNGMESMSAESECIWYLPEQHDHNERLFELTASDLKVLDNDDKDCSRNLFDFVMQYVYSEWLAKFKQKVFIFSSRFWDNELMEMSMLNSKENDNDKDKEKENENERDKEENDIIRYPFVFDKDFIFIPRLNQETKCWEMVLLCYLNRIKVKESGKRPCIVHWNVQPRDEGGRVRGKSTMNQMIRKWIGLQWNEKKTFDPKVIRAFNSVEIPSLIDERNHARSAWYLLTTFRKWGIAAGYKDTTSSRKLNKRHWFGLQQVKDFKSKIADSVYELKRSQS